MESLEAILREKIGPDLIGTSIRIGTQIEDTTVDRGVQSNLIVALVYLISYEERDRTAGTIMNGLHDPLEKMAKKNGMQFALNLKRPGPPMGRAIEIRLLSDNDVSRTAKSRAILSYLEDISGITHVELDEREGLRETELVLNQGLVNAAGLHNQDILTSLRIASMERSFPVSEKAIWTSALNSIARLMRAAISSKRFPSLTGLVVPLERFVTAGEGRSPASITHVNAMRSTTVPGNVDNRIISPTHIMDIVNQKFSRAGEVLLEFSGQPVETSLVFAGLSSASIVALIGIYLIIALTTATTVPGVLPTGYGIGGYDPFLSHMSLVLAYGPGFATIIILIIIPLLFMIGTDIRGMLNTRKRNAFSFLTALFDRKAF